MFEFGHNMGGWLRDFPTGYKTLDHNSMVLRQLCYFVCNLDTLTHPSPQQSHDIKASGDAPVNGSSGGLIYRDIT